MRKKIEKLVSRAREMADGDAGVLMTDGRLLMTQLADALESLEPDPMLQALDFSDEGLMFEFAGGLTGALIHCLGELFTKGGGKNILVMTFHHPELGRMDLSLRRVYGETPMELLEQAREEVARYEDAIEAWRKGAPLKLRGILYPDGDQGARPVCSCNGSSEDEGCLRHRVSCPACGR